MKVVVPLAGRGSRFVNAGINTPKPLVDILGKSMISWALKSLEGIRPSQLIFILLKEHDEKYDLANRLRAQYGASELILLDQVTEGQLATILTARELIDTDEDVLIANCDTYIVSNLAETILNRPPDCAGIISVANMPGDRWSFARTDEQGRVVEVAEKVRMSDHASTGFYYFSSGRQLVDMGAEMIQRGEKTRGEYYVIPVYQKYIERGWLVIVARAREMWDMGTPEALEIFKAHLVQLKSLKG